MVATPLLPDIARQRGKCLICMVTHVIPRRGICQCAGALCSKSSTGNATGTGTAAQLRCLATVLAPEAQRCRSLEIDDQTELRRLLHWQIGGFS
jgi:hypothetical protein